MELSCSCNSDAHGCKCVHCCLSLYVGLYGSVVYPVDGWTYCVVMHGMSHINLCLHTAAECGSTVTAVSVSAPTQPCQPKVNRNKACINFLVVSTAGDGSLKWKKEVWCWTWDISSRAVNKQLSVLIAIAKTYISLTETNAQHWEKRSGARWEGRASL